MTTESIESLKAQLIAHEGLKLRAYQDTEGVWTIGVGRNLQQRGITTDEAMLLLDHDIEEAFRATIANVVGFHRYDDVRQRVLVELAFNLGQTRLRGFVKMIAAIEAQDWDTAAEELIDSKWFRQVGETRGTLLARMLRTGKE